MIHFVTPTYELIEIISEDMRESDVVEVMASHGHSPLGAMTYSYEKSQYSTIAMNDDKPFLMFGLHVVNITTGLGSPWLLSCNEMFNHKDSFLKGAPLVIEDMVSICPHLVNYVHHGNRTSIKWLMSLGFTIDEPKPYGVKGDLFHKFHMGVV